MQRKACDARLFERTNESGTWGTITGLQIATPDHVLITVMGWHSSGVPFIDVISRDCQDLITVDEAPDFLALVVDMYGHLIESVPAAA